MYKITKFGSTYLPTVNVVHPQDAGPVNLQLVELPSGMLFDAQGSEQSWPAARTLTLPCRLTNYSESTLLTSLRALKALVGVRDKLYRETFATAAEEWAYARMIAVKGNRALGSRYALDLSLDFALISPVWNGTEHDDTVTLTSNQVTPTINNGGNAQVKNPVMVVTPGQDVITSLTFRRTVSSVVQEYITFSHPLPVNCSLTIDCGAFTCLLTAPAWEANHSYAANAGVQGLATDGLLHYYYFPGILGGTSGGATPTWPASGTVVDNTVTWSEAGLVNQNGSVTENSSHKSDVWLRFLPGDNTIIIDKNGGTAAAQVIFQFYDGWQ